MCVLSVLLRTFEGLTEDRRKGSRTRIIENLREEEEAFVETKGTGVLLFMQREAFGDICQNSQRKRMKDYCSKETHVLISKTENSLRLRGSR